MHKKYANHEAFIVNAKISIASLHLKYLKKRLTVRVQDRKSFIISVFTSQKKIVT